MVHYMDSSRLRMSDKYTCQATEIRQFVLQHNLAYLDVSEFSHGSIMHPCSWEGQVTVLANKI